MTIKHTLSTRGKLHIFRIGPVVSIFGAATVESIVIVISGDAITAQRLVIFSFCGVLFFFVFMLMFFMNNCYTHEVEFLLVSSARMYVIPLQSHCAGVV